MNQELRQAAAQAKVALGNARTQLVAFNGEIDHDGDTIQNAVLENMDAALSALSAVLEKQDSSHLAAPTDLFVEAQSLVAAVQRTEHQRGRELSSANAHAADMAHFALLTFIRKLLEATPAALMVNGLTEAETSATASVMGLGIAPSHLAAPNGEARSGSGVPARPTLPGEDELGMTQIPVRTLGKMHDRIATLEAALAAKSPPDEMAQVEQACQLSAAEWRATAEQAEADCARYAEALRPFARWASGFGPHGRDDSWVIATTPSGKTLTMGDVRKAAAVLGGSAA